MSFPLNSNETYDHRREWLTKSVSLMQSQLLNDFDSCIDSEQIFAVLFIHYDKLQ